MQLSQGLALGFDVPHRVVVSGIWEFPFGKNRKWGGGWNGALDGVLGGWQLNAIFQWQSGRPIDLGDESDKVYLVLFGSGIRGRKDSSLVKTKIAELDAPVLYAGAQGDLAGLDQVNVLLPRSLKGRGEVRLVCSVGSKDANQVRVAFQ